MKQRGIKRSLGMRVGVAKDQFMIAQLERKEYNNSSLVFM